MVMRDCTTVLHGFSREQSAAYREGIGIELSILKCCVVLCVFLSKLITTPKSGISYGCLGSAGSGSSSRGIPASFLFFAIN